MPECRGLLNDWNEPICLEGMFKECKESLCALRGDTRLPCLLLLGFRAWWVVVTHFTNL